jgi:transposase-like protein
VAKHVEELLNAMLNAEADELTKAKRYERTDSRRTYRAGHYERGLVVKVGNMTIRVPKLKGAFFDSQIIDRYQRRKESVDEALIEMYLKGMRLAVDDRNPGLVHALGELLPGARYQRCIAHLERNVLSKTPKRKDKEVAAGLKTVFYMEDRAKTLEKAEGVAAELDGMKLREAASCQPAREAQVETRRVRGEAPSQIFDDHWRSTSTNDFTTR